MLLGGCAAESKPSIPEEVTCPDPREAEYPPVSTFNDTMGGWAGEAPPEKKFIRQLAIDTLYEKEGFLGPYARTVGIPSQRKKHRDGDENFFLWNEEQTRYIYLEIMPYGSLSIPAPVPGTAIEAWGVVRWDANHCWTELHPLMGWRYVRR